jgi:hypothetical protein
MEAAFRAVACPLVDSVVKGIRLLGSACNGRWALGNLLLKSPGERDKVHSERLTEDAGFNEVKATLASFDFAHVALRQAQPFREFNLRKILLRAKLLQKLAEQLIRIEVLCFGHARRIPALIGITQTGILPGMKRKRVVLTEQAVEQAVRDLCASGIVRAFPPPDARPPVAPDAEAGRRLKGRLVCWADGGPFVWPRVRWARLVKAVVEEFCPRLARKGIVVFMADGEKEFALFKSRYLAKLGVTIDAAAKMPDVVVHDTERDWLLLIEAVTSAGPVDGKRRKELKELFCRSIMGLVFVTAFETRRAMQGFLPQISWETEVWVAEDPDHIIHFDGERFLGPYPDVTSSALARIAKEGKQC